MMRQTQSETESETHTHTHTRDVEQTDFEQTDTQYYSEMRRAAERDTARRVAWTHVYRDV